MSMFGRHCDGAAGSNPEIFDNKLYCFRLRHRSDGHAGDCFIFACFATSVITSFLVAVRNDYSQ
jgi:hypothetical protein